MPSVEGKRKAFSTCESPLSVVSLFYGTGFGVYISSAVTDSSKKAAVASMIFIKNMNHTDVPEFLLLGLTDDPELQPFLLGLFLSVYLVTILGNPLIILAIGSDPNLHTPMYSFLCILSLDDICISTTTIPKLLVNIQAQNQHILCIGCIAQIGFVLFFFGFENCLLAAMAYDCYVAICHPLRYSVIMTPQLCAMLILLSVLLSIADALLHNLMAMRLSFCTNGEIPHFF
ncbi:Olfactory Receptor 7G3 [Manis pentadactyla]|nr:Olfactory Receptor 7G3 [Manis pentadactyla]